jgi:hypothetical protein
MTGLCRNLVGREYFFAEHVPVISMEQQAALDKAAGQSFH